MPRKGTIAVEEAVISPGAAWILEADQKLLTPGDISKEAMEAHRERLSDIHEKRLKAMDEEGVEYMLLSLTAPGCQGIADQKLAEETARESNDWLSCEINKNPDRFGGLAALSLHDPQQAATELERAVKELGFFGGLLNDYQTTGDGTGKAYFDSPKYDPFWEKVEELDVPIYFHPRFPTHDELRSGTRYGDRPHLIGAGVQFHLDLSYHIYAMCSSGLLDRFPKVQLVVGHLGENIPMNLWRACHWLNKPMKRASRPCKEDYSYYFSRNIHITTSGNFNTRGLKYCMEELGVERCLFSIDTPYDRIEEAQEWWRKIDLSEVDKEQIGRKNAIKLFKLPLEL